MSSIFRIIGWAEGVSCLVLLGVAMPLKYGLDMPMMTRVVGMAHGVLFIAYVTLATWIAYHQPWPLRLLFQSYIASLLPFGTFVFQKKLDKASLPVPSSPAMVSR